MKNLCSPIRYFLLMAVVVLLGIVAPSVAFANTNSSNTANTAANTVEPQQDDKAAQQQAKAKPKTATKPREKSILGPGSANSPVCYFKDIFASDEDENSDITTGSGTLTVTVKALVAALLSTIM